MYEFLNKIAGLNQQEKEKLIHFGTDSPTGLLSAIDAAPEAFERFFGADRTGWLKERLVALVPPHERATLESLKSLPKQRFPLGVIVDRPMPGLKPLPFDIAERDRLFNHIRDLRQMPNRSPEAERLLEELEGRLEKLLSVGSSDETGLRFEETPERSSEE